MLRTAATEAQLDQAFSKAVVSMAILHLDGTIRRTNAAWERLLGFTMAEMEGRHVLTFLHSEDRAAAAAGLHNLLETGTLAGFECRLSCKDGSNLWIEIDAHLERDQKAIYAAAHNVTKRKRLEEALRASEERFRTAFEDAALGMTVIGPAGQFLHVNRALSKITGYTEQELLEKGFVAITHPDDRSETQRKAGDKSGVFTKRYIRKDGQVVWVRVSFARLSGEGGEVAVGLIQDLTEEKRSETVRRRYELLSGRSRDVILFYRRKDGRILEANSAAQNTYGYTRDELLEMTETDLRAPERRWATELLTSEADEHGILFETVHQRKDGSVFPAEVSVQGADLDGDRVLVSVVRNIAERQRDEQELRKTQEWLRFTLRAVEIGLCYRDGKETKASNEQFRLYGLEPQRGWLTRKEWLETIHPDDRERVVQEQNAALREDRPYQIQFRVVWPDGTVRWLFSNGRVFTDEQEGGPKIEVTADVTDRVRALSELEAFFLACQSPLAVLDFNGCIRRANPALLKMSGFTVEQLRGKPYDEFFHPDDREMMRAEMKKICESGGEACFECRGLTRNGSSRWLLLSAKAVKDERSVYAVAHDISTLKSIEGALRANAEKLARSNEDLERFAYVASHDLQEPLRMVASFTQLLGKRYSGRLDATADRYIGFAVDGAKRMQDLITALLTYSRVNTKDLEIQPTGIEAVVKGSLMNLQATIAERGATVTWDALPALPVDARQMSQLFQNLIGNAIKFCGEAPKVHISAADEGTAWRFSIRDNGIGLDPQHSERIFEIFQRLHGRGEYPGTGIGLAICKRVVERHGGRIWVESSPRAGADFRFTIPSSHSDGIA